MKHQIAAKTAQSNLISARKHHVAALGLLVVLGLAGCAEHPGDTPAPVAAASAEAVADTKLTGTAFGTSPAYNPGYEFGKAFDGSLTTFFDAAPGSGGYAGLELPSGQVSKVTQIRFVPREWMGSRMVGGKFQGSSTSASSGYQDLYTITSAPKNGWNTLPITTGDSFRWLRYVGPDGSHCNIAELEFYTASDTEAPATPVPAGAVSGPPAGSGTWAKSFEDNFDAFDASKWVKRWACGNGNELGCTYQDRQGTAYEDANVYVADGKLHIKTERKTTRGNAFTSGVVTTSIKNTGFTQKYGYFEVRMKPASSPGNDPDFWLFPLSKPSAEPFKELDFAEFGGRGGVVATTSHMPGLGKQTFSVLGNWTADFHTYGVLWDAGKVSLYIDGVLQPGSITRNIVDEAGVLILSDEVRKDNGDWFGNSDNFGGPAISQVDWVRVWRKN
jgi:hypothetical protein